MEKRGRGRPPGSSATEKHLINPKTLDTIERLAQKGLPWKMIYYFLNVPEVTARRIKAKHPIINERYMRGRAAGVSKVAETALDLATSGKDPATTRWWLEKMAPGMLTHEENESDHKKEDEQLTRDSIVEALKKDKFLDVVEVSSEVVDEKAPPKDVTPKKQAKSPAKVKDPMLED